MKIYGKVKISPIKYIIKCLLYDLKVESEELILEYLCTEQYKRVNNTKNITKKIIKQIKELEITSTSLEQK